MRPRLASLALLLLALCRHESAGAAPTSPWTGLITEKDSEMTFKKATKDAQAAKLIAGYTPTTDLTKLEAIFGDALHALILKSKDAAKFEALPAFYKKSLVNGVLCELAETDIDKKVATALYGAADGKVPAAQIALEQALAKTHHGIDCADAAKTDPCLCTAGKEKPLLYCITTKQFTGTKTACLKEAIDELKNFGKKGLGKFMTNEIPSPPPPPPGAPIDEVKKVTHDESSAMADAYCDAADPAVFAITEKLYSANGFMWTMEELGLYAKLTSLDGLCDDDQKKNSARGQCMCSKKNGLTVCMAANIGTLFKNKGYLDCAATPAKFDSAKKDSVTADLVAYENTGELPSSNPAPGPGGPTAGPPAGGNETTTAATGGAATASSLLLAPLAAAAAALLLL